MRQTATTTHRRDTNLDIYRGCFMIYIVSIIHNLYGVGSEQATWMGLLLIEMPIVFFVTGASFALSTPKSYPQYVWSKVKRIVFPYYIMVALVTISYGLYHCVWNGMSISAFLSDFIDKGYYNIFSGKLYKWTVLWFIPIYLIVSLILPLLSYIKQHITQKGIYLMLCVVILLLAIEGNNVLCYGAFAFIGMYYKEKSPINLRFIAIVFALILIISILWGDNMNMQYNKFPPNLLFFAYTSLILILIGKPLAWLCQQLHRIPFIRFFIDLYARKGFTIYLYHTIVINLVATLAYNIALRYDLSPMGHIALTLLSSILLFFGSAAVGAIMYQVEQLIMLWGEKLWLHSKKYLVKTEKS